MAHMVQSSGDFSGRPGILFGLGSAVLIGIPM